MLLNLFLLCSNVFMNKRVDYFSANAPSTNLPLNRFIERTPDACAVRQAKDGWVKSPTQISRLASKPSLKNRLVWERPVGSTLSLLNLGSPSSSSQNRDLSNPSLLDKRVVPLNTAPCSANRSVPRVPLPLPLMGCSVAAGFPSPAEDWIEGSLDLNSHLIPRPSSTFLFRVSGTSMINAGIMAGALLVVDRAIEPRHGAIVIAHINGELTVKRLFKRGGITRLDAENPAFRPLVFTADEEITIWGVVSHSVVSF